MQHQARAVVAREQVTIPARLTHKTPPLPTLRRITPLFFGSGARRDRSGEKLTGWDVARVKKRRQATRKDSNMKLRDRSSSYCFLNEAAAIALEHKLATTPEDRDTRLFRRMPRGAGWPGRSVELHDQFGWGARHPRAWTCWLGGGVERDLPGRSLREGSLAGSHKPDKTSGGNNSNP